MDICIIKLDALGDVVRTLPVLLGIKENFPNSNITWITNPDALELIKRNNLVTKALTPADIFGNIFQLNEFDILYNLDTEKQATDLALKIPAKIKKGFYAENDFLSAFNLPAQYYLDTIYDDELKKTNKKTYQEMMFNALELPYKKQHYQITLLDYEKDYAQSFLIKNNLNTEKLIGIHFGASQRWPCKKWHKDNLIEFIEKAHKKDYKILLFAGPSEIQEQLEIFKDLSEKGIKIYLNNPKNSLFEFASLVELCKVMITADSLSMHISLSLKKPTVTLFFCTSPNEVESYNLLTKVVSPLLKDFFPEKSDQYSGELVKSISSEEVLNLLEKLYNS